MPAIHPDSIPGARPPLRPGPQTRDDLLAKVNRFYSWRAVGVLFGLFAYLCTLGAAPFGVHYLAADGARQLVVVVVPMLTAVLLVSIIFVIYLASDEYVRNRILKCAALTAIILAFSTLGYFCLELLGHARLPMIVVNLYGWGVFSVMLLWVLYRAR
jgi:hypothetical protein